MEYPKIEERGQFGDSFRVVNALFAGLAFAGVILAILLQQKELKLQREELELQRTEIRGQKETLQKQNFESSFFQLLNRHSEIVNSIVMSRHGETENIPDGDALSSCSEMCIGIIQPKP